MCNWKIKVKKKGKINSCISPENFTKLMTDSKP